MNVPWTAAERRWRDVLLAAVLPPGERQPGLGAVDLGRFWSEYRRSAPAALKLGFRVAVTTLTWAPVARFGAPLHQLDDDRRDEALRWLASSRNPAVAQLVLATKLVACFAAFSDDRVRAGFPS